MAVVAALVVSVRRADVSHDMLSIELAPEFTLPGSGAPSPSPPTEGVLGLMAPPEGALGGHGGLLGDWTLLEVGKGTVTTTSHVQPEPQLHTAPSFSMLHEAALGSWSLVVHGADDATWAEVATALAAKCDHTVLVLGVSRP